MRPDTTQAVVDEYLLYLGRGDHLSLYAPSENAVHVVSFVVESVPRGGTFQIYPFWGCDTDELERAADELEKATSELVRRAEELAKRSEELNRQLLRLAEALARPTMIRPPEVAQDSSNSADRLASGQPQQDTGILAEVKEFLDGPDGQTGLSWHDPRD